MRRAGSGHVADTSARGRRRLCAASRAAALLLAAAPFAACAADRAPEGGAATAPPPLADDGVPRRDRLVRLLGALAADSMMGREAGTAGERMARDVLVAELERYGVEPAGEEGYLQRVPLVGVRREDGSIGWTLPAADQDPDTFPDELRRDAWNVLGMVPGDAPGLADEVVIVGAHYDHVGVGEPLDGDSVYNGADDDATGTVAALEVARGLARGEAPGRSVLVALFSAEEMGLLGPRWFLEHPTVARERLVADLQIEMIGRPDSLAGGAGRGWLTGYERSTMGDLLREQGSPIVPDPRPEMRFFFRSDNTPFALAGIPAHTLSSYGMHADYHTPDDEADRVDPAHMTALVDAAEAMVRALARGPRPEWHEGGQPTP